VKLADAQDFSETEATEVCESTCTEEHFSLVAISGILSVVNCD